MKKTVALIAHVFAPFDRGGVTTYVTDLARELSASGWDPFVFHPFTDLSLPDYMVERTEVDGLRVVRVNRHALLAHQEQGDVRMEQIFAQVLIDEGAALAHFHHLCESLSPSLIERAWTLGIPSHLTLHDSWTVCYRGHGIDSGGNQCSGPESVSKCAGCVGGDNLQIRNALGMLLPLRNAAAERALRLCESVSAPTQYLADVIHKAPWLSDLHIDVRPLGLASDVHSVDTPQYDGTRPLRLGLMGNFGIRSDGIDVKGGAVLTAAAAMLAGSPVEFDVHGSVDEHFTAEFAAHPNINVRGTFGADERQGVLESFDALLITSRIENFSTVAREAQLAGVPVISSNAGGLGEIVHDGLNGLLFPSGNASALTAAIRRVIDSPELLAKLRTNAQAPALITADAAGWMRTYDASIGDLLPPVTNKKITAVISTFDKPDLLRRALAGFVGQTLPQDNFEVIVVDDCSPIEPLDVIAEFQDQLPLVYIRHESNKGLGETRNTAIDRATGDFVAFFDDDNTVGPRLLAEHVRTHLENPGEHFAALAYTGLHPEAEMTNVLWSTTQTLQTYVSYRWMPHGAALPWHCAWGGCSSFKVSLLRRYPYEVKWMEDMDLAWRMRSENLTVIHNRHAVQYIMESETVDSWLIRSRRQGRAAAVLASRHPEPEFQNYLGAPDVKSKLIALKPQLAQARATVDELDTVTRPELQAGLIDLDGSLVSKHLILDEAYRVIFEYERLSAFMETAIELGLQQPLPTGQKILVIDVLFPMADRSSGANRLTHLLQMMVDAGHEVTFLAMNGDNQMAYAAQLRSMGVETISGDPQRLAAAFGATNTAAPLDLPRLLTERNFDLAFIEFYYVAEQYLTEIRRYSPKTRVVIDTVDIHFVRERRQASIAGDTAMAAASETTRQREQAIYSQADDVIAITEADRSAILSLVPGAQTQILPNVHDSHPSNVSFGNRKGLLFVGNFIHPPNVDAMEWFARDIWPAVRRAIPNIELTVVGNNPPAAIRNVPGIKTLGYVPSMTPYLDAARLSIAPLRSGAGMKGKVGEALASGLPVVATTMASEGMHLVSGTNVMMADDPESFAANIVRAYNDKELWTRLAKNGLQHVDALYGTEAVRGLLGQIITPAPPAEPQIFAVVPTWNNADALRNTIDEYTRTFGASDNVTLVMGVEHVDMDTAGSMVMTALGQLGLDPEHIADIELIPWTADSKLPANTIWLTQVG